MRVVMMSDTHGGHGNLVIPEGDLLVHAGDFTLFGEETHVVRAFARWMGALPHPHKVLVPGNHELVLTTPRQLALFRRVCEDAGVTFLLDDGVHIGGALVYGSPWQPTFGRLAFNAEEDELRETFRQIPPATSILVTHSPPRGILDGVAGMHHGSTALAERLLRLDSLKLHVFGHIHEGAGVFSDPDAGPGATIFVNAAMARRGHQVRPGTQALVVDLEL